MPHLLKLSRSAFSLVELSIVLVILGLLVGGVLSGRSLIRASELRAVPLEREKFTAAVFSFRDKYFQLPGDMPNAFQFWGAACGTNTTTASTGCNGDGDNYVGGPETEAPKAWEHLALASLIEGAYNGVLSADGGVSTTNSVKSKFPRGYWLTTSESGNAAGPLDSASLYLQLGSIGSGTASLIPDLMARGDAWSIDKKTDDGQGSSGKMRGDAAGGCLDSGTDYYNLQGTNGGGNADTVDCMLYFILN